jgi:hypothetical protein
LDWSELPQEEKKYFRPAVTNSSIGDGHLNDSSFVFYPYGKAQIADERELRRRLPSFYAKALKPAEQKLRSRKSKRDPERWWEMSEPIHSQIEPAPKLVSVAFGDAGSFAYDTTGDFVVVQGYFWNPKSLLRKAFVVDPKLPMAYLAILNSEMMSQLLAATSNQVQGGQWDLSARYVENIPMPNLADIRDGKLINDLSEVGMNMASGKDWDVSVLSEAAAAAFGVRNI